MESFNLKIAAGICWAVSAALAQPATAPPTPVASRSGYVLGADDLIAIRVLDAEEVSDKGLRIPPGGVVNLALVGRVQISGLTAEELEKDLANRLKPFIRNPEVSVNVIELRSQPVSVIGAVKLSGVHQLQGRKTLVEVLSLAGGLQEDAGYRIKITRQKEWGMIPLPGAGWDSSGQFSVAQVNVKDILDARNPVENIPIMPNDVITVPKAEMIYVVGDVKKSGGFILGDRRNMSVLQALSMGGGLEKTAASNKAKILRASDTSDAKRIEISVNLKNILTGKDEDVAMQPQDILFVPGSRSKAITLRALEAAITVGTGLALYRP